MKKKIKHSIIFILFGFILTLLPVIQAQTNHITYEDVIATRNSTIHNGDPNIIITDDDDFYTYSFTGSGSQLDPFLIENFTIVTVNEGISIFNTTKYFTINNCTISSTGVGINIDSVASQTANIVNNTISCGIDATCISLTGCPDAKIRNNICENGDKGIYVFECDRVTISNNTCIDNNDDAIYLEQSSNSVIKNNNCSESILSGIEVFIAGSCSIINNTCYHNNWHGILLSYCTSATVVNNTCLNNHFNGLSLSYSSVSTYNNTFMKNNMGIRLTNSNNGIYAHNFIKDNSDYGMYITISSDNNVIHHNIFANNKLGSSSQAYDDGTNNIWYDTVTSEGNCWGENIIGNYAIDGTASAVDPYPLNCGPFVSEYSNFYLALLMILTFLTIPVIRFIYRKKKRN